MTEKALLKLMSSVIKNTESSLGWLQYSYKKCASIKMTEKMPHECYDDFEALTARFARSSDLLLQKYYRTLDAVELAEKGTLLDAIHRAEKRGIIDSVDQIRNIHELRNLIAHEYADSDLIALFGEIFKQTPLLIQLIERAIQYGKKYLKN